jgi:hypothetical protein
MAAPKPFIRSLIAYAVENGRSSLAAIRSSQFSVITTTGGKQLTGVAAGGKSFTYTIPQGLSVLELIEAAQVALEYYDTLTEAQRTTLTTRAPITRTVISFS